MEELFGGKIFTAVFGGGQLQEIDGIGGNIQPADLAAGECGTYSRSCVFMCFFKWSFLPKVLLQFDSGQKNGFTPEKKFIKIKMN